MTQLNLKRPVSRAYKIPPFVFLFHLIVEKYSVYEVKVSASTIKGEGQNTSKMFRTKEDGKV